MFGCTSIADSPSQPRQNQPAADLCYKTDISSLMDFNSPDTALDKGEVSPAAAQPLDLKAPHLPAVTLNVSFWHKGAKEPCCSLVIFFFSRQCLLINF